MAKKQFTYHGSKKSTTEWAEMLPYRDKIRSLVRAARYREAYRISNAAYKKYPKNRFAVYNYAVQLGDCSEWANAAERERNRRRAVKLLGRLMRQAKGINPLWVSSWSNEYFWFSKQPLKQYKLGLRIVAAGDKYGYYSMGVGAAMLALLNTPKRKFIAQRWARKSISAWENYFKVVPDYYNAYVWYAKALGLSGDIEAMDRALKKASKLSGRPISYQEFAETRKEVLAALAEANRKTKSKRK